MSNDTRPSRGAGNVSKAMPQLGHLTLTFFFSDSRILAGLGLMARYLAMASLRVSPALAPVFATEA